MNTTEPHDRPALATVKVSRKQLEQLANGLENCVGNAKLRHDEYDAGYMGAMLKQVKGWLK